MRKFLIIIISTLIISLNISVIPVTADSMTLVEGDHITSGGTYLLSAEAKSGAIYIDTTESVTIVGRGIIDGRNEYLTLDCTIPGVDLTIENVRIDNATEAPASSIRFTGKGNHLTLEGNNILQQCFNTNHGRAIICVPENADLTIDGSGTLYMYKHSKYNAGIGGDAGKASGEIIINGGNFRLMGVNGGALIGSDKKAGPVTINGGSVSLWADKLQTCIGGYDGALCDDITINGGIVSLEGGDNLAGSLDPAKPGNLIIKGGILFADDHSNINANVIAADGSAAEKYTLKIDNRRSTVTSIRIDDTEYFTGSISYFKYNEKKASATASTPDTWDMTEPDALDLYLNKKDHTLSLDDFEINLGYDPTCGFYEKTAEEPEPITFTDIEKNWAKEYIILLARKGIVNGRNQNIFAPDDFVTRAEFVKIIAAAAGFRPDSAMTPSENAFTDVAPSSWFAPYVSWASTKALVFGYNGKFDPDGLITRQDLAVITDRFYQFSENVSADEFHDQDLISDYALDSVKKMHGAGILAGKPDGEFHPKDNTTRAEACRIICAALKCADGR